PPTRRARQRWKGHADVTRNDCAARVLPGRKRAGGICSRRGRAEAPSTHKHRERRAVDRAAQFPARQRRLWVGLPVREPGPLSAGNRAVSARALARNRGTPRARLTEVAATRRRAARSPARPAVPRLLRRAALSGRTVCRDLRTQRERLRNLLAGGPPTRES